MRHTYFSPYDDAQTAFINLLQSAKKKIRIAIYALTLEQVIQILIQKHQAGLDVAVILDSYEASNNKAEVPKIQELQASGVNMVIGTSSKHQIMHDKFVVVDDFVVASGSYNFTGLAQKEDNVLDIEHSQKRAAAFTATWQRMHDYIVSATVS